MLSTIIVRIWRTQHLKVRGKVPYLPPEKKMRKIKNIIMKFRTKVRDSKNMEVINIIETEGANQQIVQLQRYK